MRLSILQRRRPAADEKGERSAALSAGKRDITIILATWNGERFLEEQLESIAAQTCGDWRLAVFDDGSSDSTVDIAQRFAREHPGSVDVFRNEPATGSAKANFMQALGRVEPTPYFMFCDQDDVWHADKVEKTLACMHRLEDEVRAADVGGVPARRPRGGVAAGGPREGSGSGSPQVGSGAGCPRAGLGDGGPQERSDSGDASDAADVARILPLLVYTDQEVVDERLETIAPSMMKYSTLDGRANGIGPMLVQNVVTGCTMMGNRALWELARTHVVPPDELVLHDWWLGQIAAALGKLAYLDEPTMLYRQHGDNSVGAYDASSGGYLVRRLREGGFRDSFAQMERQAAFLLEQFGDEMTPTTRAAVEAFSRFSEKSKAERLADCRRYGIWKTGWHRRLAEVLFI
jgi:hypothetical protein